MVGAEAFVEGERCVRVLVDLYACAFRQSKENSVWMFGLSRVVHFSSGPQRSVSSACRLEIRGKNYQEQLTPLFLLWSI